MATSTPSDLPTNRKTAWSRKVLIPLWTLQIAGALLTIGGCMWYLGDYDGEFGLSYSYTSNLEIRQSVSYLYRTTKCSQYLKSQQSFSCNIRIRFSGHSDFSLGHRSSDHRLPNRQISQKESPCQNDAHFAIHPRCFRDYLLPDRVPWTVWDNPRWI